METKIDRFGKVLIPEELRHELELSPGTLLRIVRQDGSLVLEPIQRSLLQPVASRKAVSFPDEVSISPPGILARDIEVHVDGGARGNPGPAAYAFVVHKGGTEIYREGQPIGTATNNEAEYRGLIAALQWMEKNDLREGAVFMDSELVVQQVCGNWKVKSENLRELHRVARGLYDLTRPRLRAVPRESNTAADREVNRVLDRA